jgi:hypothetical protein
MIALDDFNDKADTTGTTKERRLVFRDQVPGPDPSRCVSEVNIRLG